MKPPLSAKLGLYTVFFRNSEEYHHLKQEIFTQDCYYFETENPAPRIIDAGAHIGMATLYFKKIFPAAQIIAIEPLPQNVEWLEMNVWQNQLSDVEIVPAALAAHEGIADLYFDTAPQPWLISASFTEGAWSHTQQSEKVVVPTLPLASFLEEPVDFLKLDVEGAEEEVLYAAREHLHQIKHCMIEYHPSATQSLDRIVKLLGDLGFQITLWQKGKVITQYRKGLAIIEAKQEVSAT